MLFESLLMLGVLGLAVLLIGIPLYKLVREIIPKKRNPVAEAKQRLELARLESEAAKLNKEAEKIYESLYTETLNKEKNFAQLTEEERQLLEEESSEKGKKRL